MTAAGQEGGPKPRVVVVEDDASVLRMLHALLSTVADVVLAVDGVDALEKMTKGPVPALVVTDLMMPRMDGITLARRIRADARLAGVPVIMLTARAAPGDAITGLNAGALHYVAKPFKPDELLEKVRRVLRLP